MCCKVMMSLTRRQAALNTREKQRHVSIICSPADLSASRLAPAAPRWLYDLPLQALAKAFKQSPIVQPHYWLARFHIDRNPAPLRLRGSYYFNSAHHRSPSERRWRIRTKREHKSSALDKAHAGGLVLPSLRTLYGSDHEIGFAAGATAATVPPYPNFPNWACDFAILSKKRESHQRAMRRKRL
jgi:hypothetical protein